MRNYLPLLLTPLLALAACGHHGNRNKPPVTHTSAKIPTSANSEAAAAHPASATSVPPTVSTQNSASTDQHWVEGKNYFLIQPAQPTGHPDKVVVTEVFSYACIACNAFQPIWARLVRAMPSNVVIDYLPASFIPSENWPLFQRAYFTARAFGVAKKAHEAMFKAVWKTGKLGIYDPTTHQVKPKSAWPNLENLARFYARYGVDQKQFISTAYSFSVNMQMKRADQEIMAIGTTMTPTIMVNGKYRLTPISAGGYGKTIALTQWLVSKETAGK